MGTVIKRILVLLVICCFIRDSIGLGYKAMIYPESGKCESDEDCVKGKATCVRRECHCHGNKVGDGKTKCEEWKKCPPINMYSAPIEPCGNFKGLEGEYQHSHCLQSWIDGYRYWTCKCHAGYFARANHPQCWGAIAYKDGRIPCVAHYNCHVFARCKFSKCYCNDGYEGNGDKCIVGSHGGTRCIKDAHCPEYSSCLDERCRCRGDLVGNGGTCKLAPLIDCVSHDFCGVNSTCINGKCICKGKTVGGGKECREYQPCPKGHKYCGDSNVCLIDPFFPKQCAALNDCEKQGMFCPRFSVCEKKDGGSPNCVCIKGFRSIQKGATKRCQDINECNKNRHSCPDVKVCENRVGGYDCVCKIGLRADYDGNGDCVPLNDCDNIGLKCPRKSKCEQIPSGSYDCVCVKGYKTLHLGDKRKSCEDVNECITAEASCSGDRCKNTAGSYTCVPCLPGFTESDEGICVATIKGACNCYDKTEECRRGKCRCRTALGYQRNKKGHCVRPPGREIQPRVAHSTHIYSHVTILIIGLLSALAFTRT